MGKYSNHASYFYKDIEVPSVTTILKVLHKPSLVNWANYLGFKRTKVDDVLKEKAEIGTSVHNTLYAYLMKRFYIFIGGRYATKQLIFLFMKSFVEWERNNELIPEFMEKQFSVAKFGGTIDFYGTLNGKKSIVDFKTSSQFYPSMFIQLGAYCYMLEEHGYEVEQVAILKVNTSKTSIKIIPRKNMDKFIEIFLTLTKVFHENYTIEEDWRNMCE